MCFDSKARSRPPSVSSQMTPPRYSLKGWSRCSNQKRQMSNLVKFAEIKMKYASFESFDTPKQNVSLEV